MWPRDVVRLGRASGVPLLKGKFYHKESSRHGLLSLDFVLVASRVWIELHQGGKGRTPLGQFLMDGN